MSSSKAKGTGVLTPEAYGTFVARNGGAVEPVDLSGCPGLSGYLVGYGNYQLEIPQLDHHLLEMNLEGKHNGTSASEGMVTSSSYASTPGSVSFYPAGRRCLRELVGQGQYLQLLVSVDWMEQAKFEMLRGDPDQADLFGFNTLFDSSLEKLMASLAEGRRPITNPLEADMVVLDLSREIVRNFTNGHLFEDEKTPRLSSAQLIRSMDLIESCISLNTGLDSIAKALGLPLEYFLAAFEEATDLNASDFLRTRQIDRAVEWLSIVKIDDAEERAFLAQACGFEDFKTLDAAFKRQHACSIAEFISSRL
jgi:AraC-like DNA-binding protein